MEGKLPVHQISLLFLFSYPCCHVRYSFVPCKYICYRGSISFCHLFVLIPNCFCDSKLTTAQENGWSVTFSFICPVMKSGFTEARGRGNSRSGGPNIPTPAVLSRCTGSMWYHPRQEVWGRSTETFNLITKARRRTTVLYHVVEQIPFFTFWWQ